MGETIQIEVSGLLHYAFAENAAALPLEAQVRLVREPGNRFDPAAIRVELEDGTHLGYLEKGASGRLASVLDPLGGTATAFVAAIEGGAHAEQPRLRIAFVLPDDTPDPWGDTVSGYCFQPDGELGFLLVDCARATLESIQDALGPLAAPGGRFGPSTKRAPDGRRYRWVARLEPAPGGDCATLEAEVDRRLGERFGVKSHARLLREARAAEQEKLGLVREFASESEAKQRELAKARKESEFFQRAAESYRGDVHEAKGEEKKLRDRVLALEAEIEGRRRRAEELQRDFDEQKRAREELEMQAVPGAAVEPGSEHLSLEQLKFVVVHTCPLVRLLRDSEEAIAGLPNQGPLLRELSRLDAPDVKGERVEGTTGWSERHFSTGHGNDGRLYYRRRGDHFEALVSLKQTQTRDVRYLGGL